MNTSRRIEPRREDKIEMGIVQRAVRGMGLEVKIVPVKKEIAAGVWIYTLKSGEVVRGSKAVEADNELVVKDENGKVRNLFKANVEKIEAGE